MIGSKVKTILTTSLLLISSLIIFYYQASYASQDDQANPSRLGESLAGSGEQLSPSIIDAEVVEPTSHKLYLPMIQGPADPEPNQNPSPTWLSYLNMFREQANLNPLEENKVWSNGGYLHSRYMVKNNYITHYENPANSWYTEEGYEAGRNGNVFVSSYDGTTDEMAINFWMMGPFHAISMLDPQLIQTSLGSYREDIGGWEMGATLDVLRGRQELPPGTTFPITFPRNGGEIWLRQFTGNEWPDPLTSCPGYTPPSGPPIMIQIGEGNLTPNVTDYRFSTDGSTLPACLFDETSYVNPESGTQSLGRAVLNSRDAIIIMPRDPLVSGQDYDVSVTVNGSNVAWSFSVVSSPLSTAPDMGYTFEIR
jgi:uncharacterized protein YkwD